MRNSRNCNGKQENKRMKQRKYQNLMNETGISESDFQSGSSETVNPQIEDQSLRNKLNDENKEQISDG